MNPKRDNIEPRATGTDRSGADLEEEDRASDPGPPHWNRPLAAEEWDNEDTEPSGQWVRFGKQAASRQQDVGAETEAVANLNECLRGELSAVETYDLALAAVNDLEAARVLRQLRDQHEQRVLKLREHIRSHGGQPVSGSGAWGLFAKLVQRGADLLGDRAVAAALEEGEDHGVRTYTRHADDFQPQVRELVLRELLPAQQASHDLCHTLQRFVKAA
jgi:hypothetical protein